MHEDRAAHDYTGVRPPKPPPVQSRLEKRLRAADGKRRLQDAGLPHLFSPHSFRVAVVTDLLNENVPLEDVQYLAGHSNPKT